MNKLEEIGLKVALRELAYSIRYRTRLLEEYLGIDNPSQPALMKFDDLEPVECVEYLYESSALLGTLLEHVEKKK